MPLFFSVTLVIQFLISSAFGNFNEPLIIGHRGASGYRPEHTLEAYKLAIEIGADFVEPDLVMTKDKVLIIRHENEISETTDVAKKFPDRKKTKTVDGQKLTGWFTEDLTLKEIKTLRAKERLAFRDHSFDGKFEIPTFHEFLELIKSESKKYNRTIGVYPETKHPSYFASIGLPFEEALVSELMKFDLNKKESPVFIQSFELEILRKLKKLTPVKLIFLFDDPEKIPYDLVAAGKKTTYQELTQPQSLKEMSSFLSGIGPYKRYIVPVGKKGEKLPPTTLISDAHAVGLLVHPYTFRSEDQYLLKEYLGDPQNEYLEFFNLGVDGLFSDFADQAVKAKNTYLKKKKN